MLKQVQHDEIGNGTMNEERKIEIEEVTEAPKPPKARVDVAETFERKRDYLAGFLAGIRGTSIEDLASITSDNFRTLFSKAAA